MNAQTLAKRAYGQSTQPTRTPRGVEYDLIARVTHRIKAAVDAGPRAYPQLVKALSDNQRLWTALAVDIADDSNGLPRDLRARIFYLAEFVQHQTSLVLSEKGRIAPLIEINAAMLRGLSGRGAAE